MFSALAVIVVVVIAAIVGPKGPSGPPDPTLGGANPRPEWPFLWLFGLLSLSPPSSETFIILVFPVHFDYCIVSRAVRLQSRRASAEPAAGRGAVGDCELHAAGHADVSRRHGAWSPKMTAWSGDPVPERLVKNCSPEELMGAVVFQNKSCRNCHALDGIGGTRGPDLTNVGTRLTRDQLIDQISNGTPGGGNMPAYGKQIDPAQMATLVDFLTHLRPDGQPPARDPAAGKTFPCDGLRAMNPTLDAALRSWPAAPWLLVALVLTAAVYGRGWLILRRRDPRRWHVGQLVAFLGGLATLYLALASPIESFASLLLQVHMVQHVLLMMAIPPLLWLGAPLFPLLRGLPEPIRTYWVAPLFRSRTIRRFFTRLTHPVIALLLFTNATWLWHWPAAYELAVRSPQWHYVQHFCFLGTGLLFWFPVVRPYPSRPRWSLWILLPYLFLADVQNTLLSALLTFSSKLLYPYYAEVPRLGGLSALADQSAAGVIMWVPGSIAFLVPLFWIGAKLLVRRSGMDENAVRRAAPACCLAARRHRGFDVLRVPLLGSMLKWRHARVAMQVPMFLLAALLIADGLRGPQVAAMNLAGVLPWIHWRGLLILSLLALGNVFCMACPFMLPRTIARRWLPANWNWPRWLRSKWLAVGLLGLFLWAYEAFSLWDSPWWTAWIAIGYFAAALVIDGFFRGAVFCKYLCPIGQFNFVQSLMSPLEIKVREPARCATCATKDCIRGGATIGGGFIPGCELNLYQPRKAGNMDCTFCLDCIHACPHDNIGILVAPPGKELWHDPLRSGIGRFGRRDGSGGAGADFGVRCFRQCGRDGRAGRRMGADAAIEIAIRIAVGDRQRILSDVACRIAAVIRRRCGGDEPSLGIVGRRIGANGDALQFRIAAARILDVACSLFVSLVQQLRHRDSSDATLRRRLGRIAFGPSAVELQLLPARRRLAAAVGDSFLGLWSVGVAVHGVSHRAESIIANVDRR